MRPPLACDSLACPLSAQGNRDGVLPIIAISFCWLTPPHPDPKGQQLAIIAATLEREQAKYAKAAGSFKGFAEMGVFWDWLSLFQLDTSLFREFMLKKPDELTEEQRTQQQVCHTAIVGNGMATPRIRHQQQDMHALMRMHARSVATLPGLLE